MYVFVKIRKRVCEAQDALGRLEIEARRAAATDRLNLLKRFQRRSISIPPFCHVETNPPFLSLSRFLATVLLTRSLPRGIA